MGGCIPGNGRTKVDRKFCRKILFRRKKLIEFVIIRVRFENRDPVAKAIKKIFAKFALSFT